MSHGDEGLLLSLGRERHCRGKPQGLHVTAASLRQKEQIETKKKTLFFFCPFLSVFTVKIVLSRLLFRCIHSSQAGIMVACMFLFLDSVVEIIFGFQSVCW